MNLFLLPHANGDVSIAQCADIKRHLERTPFESPVMVDQVREITADQAAAIRAARPKPETPLSVAPVSDDSAMKLLEQMVQLVQSQQARLEAQGQEIEALKSSQLEALRITRAVELAVAEKA